MPTTLLIRATRTRLIAPAPIPLETIDAAGLQPVPLLGNVSAGQPIDIYEEAEAVAIPAAWVRPNSFALRVRGGSMIDDDILDGDIVIVEQQHHAGNGETVVARLYGDQAILKRLYVEPDHIRLQPGNATLAPLILRHEEVEILGIVTAVVR